VSYAAAWINAGIGLALDKYFITKIPGIDSLGFFIAFV
jgi:hypothetical protein